MKGTSVQTVATEIPPVARPTPALDTGLLPELMAAMDKASVPYKLLDWSGDAPPVALVNAMNMSRLFRALRRHPTLRIGTLKYLASVLNLGPFATRTLVVGQRNPTKITLPARVIFYDIRGGQAHFRKNNTIANALPAAWLARRDSAFALPEPMRNVLTEFDMPVDIVFTWVDGKDPEWRARKNAASGKPGLKEEMTVDSLSDGRWDSFDELRFALRSIATNASWYRKIYVVTDRQRPAWLRETPRLEVVDHAGIFAAYAKRPTFNSHVIESQLHRIPGLSEHFLYLNDDFILTSKTTKSDFFLPNGVAKFFPSTAKIDLMPLSGRDNATTAAGKRMREMLALAPAATPVNKMRHAPYALRRSVMAEIEAKFIDDFKYLGQQQFRSQRDFAPVSQLYAYYAFIKGKAVPVAIWTTYWDLYNRLDFWTWFRVRANLAMVLCLNTSDGKAPVLRRNQRRAKKLLKRLFPLPSEFEMDDPL